MKRLGYARYDAKDADIGSLVGKELGILKPKGLIGTHLQQIFAHGHGGLLALKRSIISR